MLSLERQALTLAGINRDLTQRMVICPSSQTTTLTAFRGVVAAVVKKWGINALIVLAVSVGLSENARTEDIGRQSYDTLALNPPLQAQNIIPHGRSSYFFPLVPGHSHILELIEESGERYRRETAVLNQIEVFDLDGIGRFATAVVREEEFASEELLFRVDRWVAIDSSTSNVHIFGEVSWAINGKSHARLEGHWRAGEPDEGKVARPGLLMPGTVTVGSRLSQRGEDEEPEASVDVVATGINVTVPAGTFVECVRLRKKQLRGRKKGDIDSIWCPQVGLVSDAAIGQLISSNAPTN